MLYFKSCPRCKGYIHVKDDGYGCFVSCLQCGFSKDMPDDHISTSERRPGQVQTAEAANTAADAGDAVRKAG